MKIVRERKAHCPAFGNVTLRQDLAVTRLSEDGIPDHVDCCAQHVEGTDKVPVSLDGPVSMAPEVNQGNAMGKEFEESDDATPIDVSTAEPEDYFRDSLGESTVDLDLVHDVAPVEIMQALQGAIEILQTHAAQIAKTEKRITIEDTNSSTRCRCRWQA